jgi:hypothetical protein
MREAQFSSKAYGTHEYKDLTIEGRVQFDLLMALQVGRWLCLRGLARGGGPRGLA